MRMSGHANLPGYQVQIGEDAVLHSQQKLAKAAKELTQFMGKRAIVSLPCTTEEETLGYRSKCTFQVIHDGNQLQYAMRRQGKPVLLRSNVFPIANQRIQNVMELLKGVLNTGSDEFPHLARDSLASLSVASSWKDSTEGEGDCILTLNYNEALDVENGEAMIEEAKQICQLLDLTQLHVRSKKLVLSAFYTNREDAFASYLQDTVYLFPPKATGSWQVSLDSPQRQSAQNSIPVSYKKPDGAFFHPNARVMCQALGWMLDRISKIASETTTPSRLLEMYCGCGAHTLALAKSGLLSSIQAIELDQRLVDACLANIDLNAAKNGADKVSPIEVLKGDAGMMARKLQKQKESAPGDDGDFNILLVDPPRQGLSEQVIDLAIQVESFQHVLIVSCGHEALVRDLKLLCDHFEVVHCQQLDLFPRTDSVETLVHLKRK